MDIQFYKNIIKAYTDNNACNDQWYDLYETIFKELSSINPDDLTIDHLELFNLTEQYFALTDQFEKAQAISLLKDAANMIFKARERLEEIKQMLINRNLN
jgi:hypothetical protein